MIAIIEPYLTTTPNPEDVARFLRVVCTTPGDHARRLAGGRAHAVQCDHHARRVHSFA